jgi:coenzyme F420-reducing hydrogenase alpha subunit
MDIVLFIKNNWQFLVSVLGVVLTWFDAKKKFVEWIEKADSKHNEIKKWAKSKDLYKAAKTAYGVVSKVSKKTETKLDDKAARGLEIAMEIMEKLGWNKSDLGNGEKDVLEKIFDELHENENLQIELSKKKSPFQ